MKTFFFKLFLLCIPILLNAQEYQYVPFPDSNSIWSELYIPPDFSGENPSYHRYALFNEDSIIDNITYHKLFLLNDTTLNKQNATCIGIIREDSLKRVYYRGKHLFPTDYSLSPNDEILMYDFSVNVGDTIRHGKFFLSYYYLVVSRIDTIQINKNDFRRRIYFEQLPWLVWMEGVGNLLGLLFYSGPLPTNGMFSYLICFKQNDTIIYFNNKFDKCIPEITNVSENEKDNNNFIIYPNPVDNQSVLGFSPIFQYLELFDSKGVLIKKIKVQGKNQYLITKECFTIGLYFFKLTTMKKEFITGKFIVN